MPVPRSIERRQQHVTGERQAAAVPDGMPGQPVDMGADSARGRLPSAVVACLAGVPRAGQAGDHPGAAVEQACLHVEPGARGEPDAAGRVRERPRSPRCAVNWSITMPMPPLPPPR